MVVTGIWNFGTKDECWNWVTEEFEHFYNYNLLVSRIIIKALHLSRLE